MGRCTREDSEGQGEAAVLLPLPGRSRVRGGLTGEDGWASDEMASEGEGEKMAGKGDRERRVGRSSPVRRPLIPLGRSLSHLSATSETARGPVLFLDEAVRTWVTYESWECHFAHKGAGLGIRHRFEAQNPHASKQQKWRLEIHIPQFRV
jgi:hypothetical protein